MNSIVKSHERQGRQDRVGEMLKAASALRADRTVLSWAIEYSRKMDDPNEKIEKRILWHLDPVALRSAVTQAQQRLHVVAPEVRLEDGTVLYKAHSGGEYRELLGTKLFPSAPPEGKSRPGKAPRWCAGVEDRQDTETVPDGMKNPKILALIAAAANAGDVAFGTGDYVHRLAVQSQASRDRDIAQLMHQFAQRAIQKGQLAEKDRKIAERDNRILELEHDNTELRLKIDQIPDLDWNALAKQFGRREPEAATA